MTYYFKTTWIALLSIFSIIGMTPIRAEVFQEQKKEDSVDYRQMKIKSYQHWDLYLHENQGYLGRTFVQLKKEEGIDDFLSIGKEAQDEFFKIGQEVKIALKTLFQPDKMNYAALSNTSPKIHVHLIPRYQKPREFAGLVFKDARWGQNYAPYDKSFTVDQDVLFQIRDAIKEKL